MRKFLIIVLVVAAGIWGKDAVRGGKIESFLDRYFSPSFTAPAEYYWGLLLELAHHTPAAMDRLRRVEEKYAASGYGPLAWAERINILDEKGSRDALMKEAKRFLAAYPEHPKAELIRKKMAFIEHGY